MRMSETAQLSLVIVDERLRVDGVLDFTTAAGMAPMLAKCIAGLPGSFTVDLSGLSDFNSAVLVFMLDCLRMAAKANKQCHFSGATPALGNMLKMASLGDLIQAE
jgi:ABC-type transporter Mla MlaB component